MHNSKVGSPKEKMNKIHLSVFFSNLGYSLFWTLGSYYFIALIIKPLLYFVLFFFHSLSDFLFETMTDNLCLLTVASGCVIEAKMRLLTLVLNFKFTSDSIPAFISISDYRTWTLGRTHVKQREGVSALFLPLLVTWSVHKKTWSVAGKNEPHAIQVPLEK